MRDLQSFIKLRVPQGWSTQPLWSLFRRQKITGLPTEELLSVYRDFGVIPKASRDDNHNKESEDLSTYQLVVEGSLVTNKMKAWQGSIAISRYRGIVSPAYYVYAPQSQNCDQFLHYLLRSEPYVALYGRISKGVRINQWDLEHEALRTVPVMLPDIETQKVIADFLDRETARIDQLIKKKRRLVELLLEKRCSTSTSLVTRGLNPDAKTASSGLPWLPDVPSHWDVLRIGSIFRESFEMGGIDLPVLSVSINWGISDRELDDEDRHRIVNHIQDRNAYKRVRVGDLAYNMMRAWQGAFGVASVEGLVSPAYVVARPQREIHTPYFEPLLRTPMWIEEFRRASKGIADFRQRLYWEHFRQVRIVLPPVDEQRQIAQEIERRSRVVDRSVTAVSASVERLREFRSALIAAAVTGQIDSESWGKRGNTERELDRIGKAVRA